MFDYANMPFWQRILFSKTLAQKNHSHKIAYIAVMTAFCVVINTLEIKLGGTEFSFTIWISVFTGIVLGGVAGFGACFLGDLIGFMIHPFGEYSPWIGIATGCMALFAGLLVYLFKEPKYRLRLKLAVACVLIFFICTVGINTLYLHQFSTMTYFQYLIKRLFIDGQFYNSVVNSLLVIFGVPALVEMKALRILL